MTVHSSVRIGIGYDSHRLVAGGPLRLGGVEIPFEFHLAGHSDADVVLHAVTDALLGAVGGGDIGELFPDDAAENRHRDSADFVRGAMDRIQRQGYRVVNLDCTVVAERPKLGRYKVEMAASVARLLNVAAAQVNVKAKTAEGVGPVGLGQSMEAHCAVLVERVDGIP